MKQTLTSILAAVLCLSLLAGCSEPAPSSSSSVAPPPPPSSSSEPVPPPEPSYAAGVTTETAYSSEFWDLAFATPGENVVMASDEQVAELLGLGAEQLGTDNEIMTQALSVVQSCEMMAMDVVTGSNLTVLVSELPMSGITPEMLLKAGTAAMELAAPGMELTPTDEGALTDVTIAGKSFKSAGFTISGEGAPTVTQQLYIYIEGKRALMITAGYAPDTKGAKESAQAMLDALTTAEQAPPVEQAAPEAKSEAAE